VGQRAAVDGRQDARHAGGLPEQDGLLPLLLYLGAVDAPSLPLRPAHGPRVEGDATARAPVHQCDRHGRLVPARTSGLGVRFPLCARLVRREPPARDSAVLRARPGPHRLGLGGRGARLMAIGVKVMKRPGARASYVRATLQGMLLTLQHIFRPKVTMQYPEEKSTADWAIAPRWRGTHRMLTDEQGRAKCVACG